MVSLPHSQSCYDLDGRGNWFGLCQYERLLQVSDYVNGERIVLAVDAAMHSAKVSVDGTQMGSHFGGYLPFEVDLTEVLRDGEKHVLTIVIDNGNAPDVPPGKAWDELDFCWYGGLYRGVALKRYPSVHITDPLGGSSESGGGVFLRTLEATPEYAVVETWVHIANRTQGSVEAIVEISFSGLGKGETRTLSDTVGIAGGTAFRFQIISRIESPLLWSIDSPNLYDVSCRLIVDGTEMDERTLRFGVRHIQASRSSGLMINGERVRPRGTNRHQDFPYVGYALPRAAQYRDALRIKSAGFDYVRLSHYPQSPDFLDACDEIGLIVMNCIPGWQFMGGDVFRERCFQDARDLIRRDRNHASCVFWELSLNETEMDASFMEKMQQIAREEYPGDQMITCGWLDGYDVYLHARQHRKLHTWKNGDKALVVSEYGDWEFYAANDGFDQTTGAGLLDNETNSRAFRGDGEAKLRRQALNHMIALNDTLSSSAVCDGQWSFCDYPRGYHPQRAACGVMDFFRLPKYSYHFYRSQASPEKVGDHIFIASRWDAGSALEVYVFGNGEEVELSLNGESMGRRKPRLAWNTQYLPHPPFVFPLKAFSAGELEAVSYREGKEVARCSMRTAGKPVVLMLWKDDWGISTRKDESDVVTLHAQWLDSDGALCHDVSGLVSFSLSGEAAIVGPTKVLSEAGTASIVVRKDPEHAGIVCVKAESDGVRAAELQWSW